MIAGLLIGIVIGLLIGPVIRSWLTWQQYRSADREARLADDVLRRMEEERAAGDRPQTLRSAR
jgi:ABC-type transport system involved in cytochrome bd biosynthesis fused ATPase/permease subunit